MEEEQEKLKYGYEYQLTHPRNMNYNEIDIRWGISPKCKQEYIYPTQDMKDLKYYPAICYNNRMIKRNNLYLTYLYQMDFIAFGEYFQICDENSIIYVAEIKPKDWNNPPIEKQHGFYGYYNKEVKGTPSFDWLKIKLNPKSPLIGTQWECKNIIYSYPPGVRKYNLDLREKKVKLRHENEKQKNYKRSVKSINIVAISNKM